MEPSLLIGEQQIAKVVVERISRVRGAAVPTRHQAQFTTVGPGVRISGVAVHRVEGSLNIDVELIATLKKQGSFPILAARVRRMTRQAIQTLTTEHVRRVNIRITDFHIKD
ncbi:MAG: hypothetical protein NPIRA04_24000 [Nitrospirales bacterium]|nr:MAG: hypothetical protein NPIRA04_24000 [Nitrospirales bacterium]